MKCLLLLAELCLLDPTNIYLTASMDYSLSSPSNTRFIGEWTAGPNGEPLGTWQVDHSHGTRDHGRIAVGWTIASTRALSLDIGLAHVSRPSYGDRGYEAVYAGFTWRPFRDR